MAKGTDRLHTVQSIKNTYAPEQILTAFNIVIDGSNKCLCPFHKETVPSMQVNEDYVYCFGCKESADSFELAQHLLSKKKGRSVSRSEVLTFFKDNHLPPKTNRVYATSSSYQGSVPDNLIEYWAGCMDDDRYTAFEQERLITKDTAERYKIGWRPDYEAWSIPFYRGDPGDSPVDIVQFRLTTGTKKYIGLGGHNRGSVMNAHLLRDTQEYVVVFFGSFDSILAVQDGILAVGLNGCNPFRKDEKERAQALFSQQHTIFVVPDNTESEFAGAYALADWLGAQVRFFDRELPEGCDYIAYRKLGKTPKDFLQEVLGIEPVTHPDPEMMANIFSLIDAGDPFQLAGYHLEHATKGQVVQDIARLIAKHEPFAPFSARDWSHIKPKLWAVKSQEELCNVLDGISQTVKLIKESAW